MTAALLLLMAGVVLRLRPVLVVAQPWAPWAGAVILSAAALRARRRRRLAPLDERCPR